MRTNTLAAFLIQENMKVKISLSVSIKVKLNFLWKRHVEPIEFIFVPFLLWIHFRLPTNSNTPFTLLAYPSVSVNEP